MDDKGFQALCTEYKQLSTALEQHGHATYTALGIGAAIIVVLASSKAEMGLAGVVIEYGIAMMTVGLAFMQSNLLGLGLRLVEIECLINRHTKTLPAEGVNWYSRMIGCAGATAPGYQRATLIAVVLGVAGLAVSIATTWDTLNESVKPPFWCYVIVAVPVVLVVLTLASMALAESQAARKKAIILSGNASTR
jgi:hypothetical protein